MKIIKEDILRMFFDEGKNYGEISKVYGISEYKLKKEIKNMSLSLERLKQRKNQNPGSPPEGSGGGMSFELTKD